MTSVTDREFNDPTPFLSISGIESVAEGFRKKYDSDNWYATYDNVLTVGSYMLHEEQISASNLLYLFEKPHKYYTEFIEAHVWWQLDNVVSDKKENRKAVDCFINWKSSRRDEN